MSASVIFAVTLDVENVARRPRRPCPNKTSCVRAKARAIPPFRTNAPLFAVALLGMSLCDRGHSVSRSCSYGNSRIRPPISVIPNKSPKLIRDTSSPPKLLHTTYCGSVTRNVERGLSQVRHFCVYKTTEQLSFVSSPVLSVPNRSY